MRGTSGAGSYRALFQHPDGSIVTRTVALAALGRGGYAMLPLLLLFTVQQATADFGTAALTLALLGLTTLAMPLKSRLVDRHGQRRVLVPLALSLGTVMRAQSWPSAPPGPVCWSCPSSSWPARWASGSRRAGRPTEVLDHPCGALDPTWSVARPTTVAGAGAHGRDGPGRLARGHRGRGSRRSRGVAGLRRDRGGRPRGRSRGRRPRLGSLATSLALDRDGRRAAGAVVGSDARALAVRPRGRLPGSSRPARCAGRPAVGDRLPRGRRGGGRAPSDRGEPWVTTAANLGSAGGTAAAGALAAGLTATTPAVVAGLVGLGVAAAAYVTGRRTASGVVPCGR